MAPVWPIVTTTIPSYGVPHSPSSLSTSTAGNHEKRLHGTFILLSMEPVADHNSENMLLLCVFHFVKILFGSKQPLWDSACCFSSAKLTTQKIKMLKCCHKVVKERDAWFTPSAAIETKMQRLDGKPLQSFEPDIPDITGPFFVEIIAVVFDLSQS